MNVLLHVCVCEYFLKLAVNSRQTKPLGLEVFKGPLGSENVEVGPKFLRVSTGRVWY